MQLARALAEELQAQNEKRALLIGVIAADNTYQSIYAVGYFGLRRKTGVEYDEKHDGEWWREWWKQNKKEYSQEVQDLEIPDFPQRVAKAELSSESRFADADKNMLYHLIGAESSGVPPESGYHLLLVMPGGDGGPDFHSFVRRIHENALSNKFLVAQLIAKDREKSSQN